MSNQAASIFILPNATFFAEVVAFLIILAILWRYVLPIMRKAMDDRQNQIRTQLEDARDAKQRAESAEEDYKKSIAGARAEAAQIRESARAEAQQILEDVRDKAQTETDRITRRGTEQLEAQRRQVITDLRSDIGRMSVDLAAQLVGESLADDARRSGTVDRFLADLDSMSPSGAPREPAGRSS